MEPNATTVAAMVFNWIILVLLVTGVTVLIVWGVMKIGKGGGDTSKKDALDIARERYAKGEISKEEFEQIKKDLA